MDKDLKGLEEWIAERCRRGLTGGQSSDPFHKELAKFPQKTFDKLLDYLEVLTGENQKLASGIGAMLHHLIPPLNGHQALWFYFGGHAKRLIVQSLAGEGAEDQWVWKLLFLDLNQLRVTVPCPALETVAKAYFKDRFCPFEELDYAAAE